MKKLIFAAMICSFPFQIFSATGYVAVSEGAAVIESESNTVITTVGPLGTGPISVAVTPDGTLAYVASKNSHNVFVINTETNTTLGSAIDVTSQPFAIAVAPDESFVYVTTTGGSFQQIDIATQTLSGTLTNSSLIGSTGFAISPDVTTAYICVSFGTPGIAVVDISNPASISLTSFFTDGSLPSPYQIVLSPDGTTAYVSNVFNSTVAVVDLTVPTVTASISITSSIPRGLAITPEGDFVYVTDSGLNEVHVIDASNNTVVGSPIVVGSNPQWIAITPSGDFAYVTNTSDGTVSVIDLSTNTVVETILSVGTSPQGIAFVDIPLPDPPATLTGNQKKNDFGLVYERFNTLKWSASPSEGVTSYNVYRNGIQVASLSSSHLKYEDHNIKQGATIIYAVTAVNDGGEGEPIAIEMIGSESFPIGSN